MTTTFNPDSDSSAAIATTGILTTEPVAELLNTTPEGVLRLVARRRIPGTRLGTDGPLRILESDVQRYIQVGAVDQAMPPIGDAGDFLFDENILANAVDTDLVNAMREFELSEEQARAKIAETPRAEIITIKLAVTPKIRSVLLEPIKLSLFATPEQRAEPPSKTYSNRGELWAVRRLRDGANVVLRQKLNGDNPIRRFYHSPDDYASFMNLTFESVGKGALMFKQNVNRSDNPNGGTVTFYYTLAIGLLLAQLNRARLELLAF